MDIEILMIILLSKKISNDQELIQSDPTSCPQNKYTKYMYPLCQICT